MATPKLTIAKGLSLDPDISTKTLGILAQRRSGKSYTAMVLAEEMVKAKIPWVVLDPTSAWWGLRASADGKRAGMDVLVIGGDHGQLPLEAESGKVMADLVVDQPAWYVFDFSHLESKAAERRFATDFAERFYRRKAKSPGAVHLFVDEADLFVPQRSPAGDQRMLGAFEALVRRGGIRGIGVTLISQRAAVVNKNVLEQIDILIVLRTVGPNDRKAIEAYVKAYGTDDQRVELMSSLASLDVGEAWFWEPGTDTFKLVNIRERKTFNSSATAGVGKATQPAKLAEVDINRLREQIAATVEKAKADDPKELRKTIFELKKQIETAENAKPVEPKTVEVKVPFIPEDIRDEMREIIERGKIVVEEFTVRVMNLKGEVDRAESLADRPPPRQGTYVPPKQEPLRVPRRAVMEALGRAKASDARPDSLTGPQQRVLDACAWWEEIGFPQPTKLQVGFIAGYRVGKKVGGTYGNILGQLRAADLIDYPTSGAVQLTREGRDAARVVDIEQTTEGLQAAVMERLDGPERKVLQVIIGEYPNSFSKKMAGEWAGYTVGDKIGGTFGNILGRLRSLGLIDYPAPGEVTALPVLFLEQ